jgi:AcrR family transcriptional regulator
MAPIERQRQLILAAMIRVAGAKGYGGTTVADVIEAAGTSPTIFFRHFEGEHDCFLAAYEVTTERVFDEVLAGCDGEAPWLSRMTTGLTAVVDLFAAEPALARTAVVEVVAAGADARQLHCDAIARFAGYIDAGHALGAIEELPEDISLMSTGAVSSLIFDELKAGRADRLPERLPDLLFVMLAPYVGPEVAAAEMRRVAAAH